MSETQPRSIGRYQLLEVIGQGGMGVVYRGVDTSIDRTVAIKMLHVSYSEDKDLLTRFHREARSTANLQHRNIVTVFALDDFEGAPFMVMEFLEGQSMADMIKSSAPLRLDEKIGLVVQVCEGLHYAHQRQIIHRDIKPANVLVLKDGTAKIVDFGIARAGVSETLTQTGQIIGSMHYMSPEQISGKTIDTRSDIYSLGVLLFQFLTGELPFKGNDADVHAIFMRILSDPAPSLKTYSDQFPPELDEIVARALAKDVGERYQTAEDLGYELARLQESMQRGMTAEFLAEGKAAIARQDWESARHHLQELLRVERRHTEANRLLTEVRQQLQQQQRSAQIGQLRSQAEIALADQRYDEALGCVEQARHLDSGDPELEKLATTIREQMERAQVLTEALRQGHAALDEGNLDGAETAVRRALEADPTHAEARALQSLIGREREERDRRAALDRLLDGARQQIAGRDFIAALHTLGRAQEIAPNDPNIVELLNWAARGHQQEKQRKELQQVTESISQMLQEDPAKALTITREALERFPRDTSLQKLQQLAQRQCDVIARREAVGEISAEVRRLIDSGQRQQALATLERALQRFQGDPNLQTLLTITQAELEAETSQRRHPGDAFAAGDSAGSGERQRLLEQLYLLQNGLLRRRPVAELRLPAEHLRIAGAQAFEGDEASQYAALLTEFNARVEQWESADAELEGLHQAMLEAQSGGQIETLLDRGRLLAEQQGQEPELHARYQRLQELAEERKRERQQASRTISDLLRSMQDSQNLAMLEEAGAKISEAAVPWAQDDFLQNLVSQSELLLQNARQRKDQILHRLTELQPEMTRSQSIGRIRLLEGQAKMLAAELEDSQVEHALREVVANAETRLKALEEVLGQLQQLTAQALNAPNLTEAEEYTAKARLLLEQQQATEELQDLLRRMEHAVGERKRAHRRISAHLERLAGSVEQANSPAELDMILAETRELIQPHAATADFRDATELVERSVAERRGAVTAMMSAVQPLGSEAVPAAVVAPGQEARRVEEAQPVAPKQRSSLLPLAAAAAGLFVVLGAAAAWFDRGQPETFMPGNPGAAVSVDGVACGSPCSPSLRPGSHQVVESQAGFADVQQQITVPWGSRGDSMHHLPVLSASATAASAPAVSGVSAGAPAAKPAGPVHQDRLLVETKVPDVSVYLNGRMAGVTSTKGELSVLADDGVTEVRVEKAGYQSASPHTVDVRSNQTARASFNLVPGTSSAPLVAALPPAAGPHAAGPPAAVTATAPAAAAPAPVATAPAAAPPTVRFTASSDSIVAGQPVTLTWHTDNAREVSIDGLGTVEPSGSRTLSPPGSTTFRMVAKGPAGTAAESLHVDVRPAPAAAAPAAAAVSAAPNVDRQGVQQALRSYVDAYQDESLDEVRKSWPTITKSQQKGLQEAFKQFNAIHVNLSYGDEDIHVSGDQATVNLRQAFTYTQNGKKTPGPAQPVHVVLHKGGSGWSIASIEDR